MRAVTSLIEGIGRGAGKVVGILYQAGRESIDQVMKNILPFMAFIALVIGIITATGVGDWLARALQPLASNPIGLIIMSLIVGFPILSPLLGPGAVMAQIIGTVLGTQFASKALPASLALPCLFAINPQVGCDFIPVGLALGEAEPYTVEVGVPSVLFSRFITGPIAVIISYFASFAFGL
jgi:sorbitol-specific phosphotransferase system component IIBC